MVGNDQNYISSMECGDSLAAQERSAALHQFRVLGQRTPDFIVGVSTQFGSFGTLDDLDGSL